MQQYEHVLKKLKKIIGNDTTTDSQLEKIGKKLIGNGFGGVFPRDKMTFKYGPFIIVNTDTSDLPGEHWVALVKDNGKIYGYDSFGRKLTSLGFSYSIKDSELDAEQKIHQTNCGQRCLAWLYVYKRFGRKKALTI